MTAKAKKSDSATELQKKRWLDQEIGNHSVDLSTKSEIQRRLKNKNIPDNARKILQAKLDKMNNKK